MVLSVGKDIFTITVDKPMNSCHPDNPDMIYPVNCGYIDGETTPKGEAQRAYLIGVDMPVCQFTGKRIAVVHRRNNEEKQWVIAPEKMPFTKQQIEASIYFQEQYYDSFVEIIDDEMWDAYDELGNKLGIQVGRSMAKNLPEGVFHTVVEVYVIMPDGRILTTQRSKNKTKPLKWEVTGGSILAGETPRQGALRELKEETGIVINDWDLIDLYKLVSKEKHVIYNAYITMLKEWQPIHLQFGETMDYQFLSPMDFKELAKSEKFVESGQSRFLIHEKTFDKKVEELMENNNISDSAVKDREDKGHVVVGMSGGVDSSVAAYLLKKQGYKVTGVTMQIWEGESSQAVTDAARVAKTLDIPHVVIDFREDFKKHVIDYFINEYTRGRTPNPCVVCNRYVKWEALLDKVSKIGADYIATGHYARITKLENGRFAVCNSVTAAKDQTYALYNLTQEQLKKTIMPVGEYTKSEIRDIAASIGIEVANKPDSMEICFIPDNDYASYIKRNSNYEDKPGDFVDVNGNVVGIHQGIIHYTVGQRKGLGLALGYPVFVVAIKPELNQVVIGGNEDVFGQSLYADRVNFMGIPKLKKGDRIQAKAKIRYSHAGDDCEVIMVDDDLIKCVFDKPQRAITPGQSVVLYKDDYVIGGGVII